MTSEDRVSKLEQQISAFNMALSNIHEIEGGFPKLKKLQSLEDRVAQIQMAHENFGVRGGRNATVEGNLKTGLAINVRCDQQAAPMGGGGGGVLPPPPPPSTGACCSDDGSCSITTEEECTGTYQGDDTVCDPNPCPTPPTTGACCAEDGSCTIETESDCSDEGGTYQGDDTTCDPNPCSTNPPCDGCGFFNPDDGITYLTRITNWTVDNSECVSTPTTNCIDFETGECTPPISCGHSPCRCPSIIVGGSRIQSVLHIEQYIEGCEISETNEDLEITLQCYCQVSGDCVSEGCAMDTPDCRSEFGCADNCDFITPPFGDCSVISSTTSYENPCVP